MRFAHFFVDRPIFASVLSIVVLLVGSISFATLPVSQYPEIVPPTIQVNATYPGANAETVAATVATPIEQEINGVENMLYMTSNSSSDGSHVAADRLQGRHQSRPGERAGAEPRRRRAAEAAGGGAQSRHHHAQALARPPARRAHAVARRQLRPALHLATTRSSACATSSCGSRGSATSPSSACANTRSGSGSTPTSSSAYALTTDRRGPGPAGAERAGRGRRPRLAAGGRPTTPSSSSSRRRAASATRASSRTIIIKSRRRPAGAARATSRPSSSAARDYTTNSYLDGKPAIGIGVYQRPGHQCAARRPTTSSPRWRSSKQTSRKGSTTASPTIPPSSSRESANEVYKTLFEALLLVVVVVLVFLQSLAHRHHPDRRDPDLAHRHLRADGGASASRSTTSPCSASCSPSASSSTTPSCSSRTSSATSPPASRRARPRTRPWTRSARPSSRSRSCCSPCSCRPPSCPASPASSTGSSR